MDSKGVRRDPMDPHDVKRDGLSDEYNQSSSRDQSPENLALKIAPDWTEDEERKLRLKYDLTILPILTLCFFCMQMDRGNIGNAVGTTDFLEQVGLTQHNYNVGQQLLYLGIVLLEIPSNIVLYKVGPRWWIGGQVIAWGLVEILQLFQNNVGSFYATRFLLGLFEAGFIPAGLYCISLWYKRNETSKRFAIFYFGNLISQGATSLLAYGIFPLNNKAGLYDWQWMFLIEGLMTVFCGILLMLLLPKNPEQPYPLTRISYFTARERDIMWRRVIYDDPSKERKSESVTWAEFKKVIMTWRVYPHVLISMCGIAPVSTMLSYAPKLVADFGYEPLRTNALVSIGGWLQIPVSLALGFYADTFLRRGYALFVGVLFTWGFVIGDLIVHDYDISTYSGRTTKFAMLILTLAFCSTWQPINGSWLSINSRTPAERSVTLAMFVMGTNIGGIFGSQLFQESDGENGYPIGWGVILMLFSVCLITIAFANWMYRWLNKRMAARTRETQIVDGERVAFWL